MEWKPSEHCVLEWLTSGIWRHGEQQYAYTSFHTIVFIHMHEGKNLHNVNNCTVSTVNGHILCWYIAWFTWNGWNEVKTVLRDQTLSHGTAINNNTAIIWDACVKWSPHLVRKCVSKTVHLKLVSLHCLKVLSHSVNTTMTYWLA